MEADRMWEVSQKVARAILAAKRQGMLDGPGSLSQTERVVYLALGMELQSSERVEAVRAAVCAARDSLQEIGVQGPYRAVIPRSWLPTRATDRGSFMGVDVVDVEVTAPTVDGVQIALLRFGEAAFVEGRDGAAPIVRPY